MLHSLGVCFTVIHASIPEDEIQHVLAGVNQDTVAEAVLGGRADAAHVWGQVVEDQHDCRHSWNHIVAQKCKTFMNKEIREGGCTLGGR